MKKRLLVALTALSIFLCMVFPAYATSNGTSLLSDSPDSEILAFLTSNNIEIPDEFADDADLVDWIRDFIAQVEEKPNVPIVYSYTVSADFLTEIKVAVNGYYGRNALISMIDSAIVASAYTLQNSTFHQAPSNMTSYNCYGYAIGETVFQNPGYHSGQGFNLSMSIAQMAGLVEDDLRALGYDCVQVNTARYPTQTLSSGAIQICIRKANNNRDYHFMRAFNGNVWRHKPGGTAILTYNYQPSNSRVWTNEYYVNGTAYEGDTTYDSSIYYIIYNEDHVDEVKYSTGEHYHSGVRHYYQYRIECGDCGEFIEYRWESVPCSGPPCLAPRNVDFELF